MISWKLIIEDYGKIKSAEIKVAPLTLFVGDNNSGKSYLLSLLWGIKNFGLESLLGDKSIETEQKRELVEWIITQIDTAIEKGQCRISIDEIVDLLEQVLNDEIKKYKSSFIKKIFNSEKINIGTMIIRFEDVRDEFLEFRMTDFGELEVLKDANRVLKLGKNLVDEQIYRESDSITWLVIQCIYSNLLNFDIVGAYNNSYVYLPAARTGFMLTKDIINKVGRQNTFNISSEKEIISPFIRPINQFLDIMNDLSVEHRGNKTLLELTNSIETEMANGIVKISNVPNKEVQYVPSGYKNGIPLRLTSAVVTELSPLILILKHKEQIKGFYYEEPEMCLHPQLQHKMGKVIGRMINSGVDMLVTTHSDIILQHINNMIKLSKREDCDAICQKLGYTKQDLLNCNQVKVYQLEAKTRGKTEVKDLICGEDGFAVPTFNNALDKIMDEAYEIQG